ncbi:MAG: hypothetical protein ACE5GE_01375 [Phycisphaerae bacterium]
MTGSQRLKWRYWAQPPPLWNLALVAAVTLAILDDASKPLPPNFIMYLVGPFLVIGLAVDYIVRVGADRADRHRAADDRRPHTYRNAWRWIPLPLCWFIALAAILSDWDLGKRFELSQPALERVAAEVLAGHHNDGGFEIIGLYYFWEVRKAGPRRVEFVTGQSVMSPVGFMYDPFGSQARHVDRDLGSGWYTAKW